MLEELLNYLYENNVKGDLSLEDIANDIIHIIKKWESKTPEGQK